MSQDKESLFWNPITQTNLNRVYVEITTQDGVPSIEFIGNDDTSFNVVTFFEWPQGTKIHAEAKAQYLNNNVYQTFTLATGDFIVGQTTSPLNLGVEASSCAPSSVDLKVVIGGFNPIGDAPVLNDTHILQWNGEQWLLDNEDDPDHPFTITCSCSEGLYDIVIDVGSASNQTGSLTLNAGEGLFIDPVNGWSSLYMGTGTGSVSLN